MAIAFALAIAATPAAQAQTFILLHTFNGTDGSYPGAGVTLDAAGNLYGTTYNGNNAFKLTHSGTGWILTTLYRFTGGADGGGPNNRLTVAADGSLYGSTNYGGGTGCQNNAGCGTIFHLKPSLSTLAPWKETVLYSFLLETGGSPTGDLLFDPMGNIYGTALIGGAGGSGAVYELTPSGDGWVANILYSFQGLFDGAYPSGGVIIDRSGKLYGVTQEGGTRRGGTIYQLSLSGSTWTDRTFYSLDPMTGELPVGGLMIDSSGDVFGTATAGGTNNGGTVFESTPETGLRGLYNLPAVVNPGCFYSYLCGPLGNLVMDAHGNLYGTFTAGGIYGGGNVFKLTPGGDGWTYTSLHDFIGQSDPTGAFPTSTLAIDENGNLYGTASEGGIYNSGTVFEITP